MKKNKKQKFITVMISLIWFINGFFCKILNLVPRHQEIVVRILNEKYARELTFTIGVLEILMTIWILSNYKSKFNAIIQIVIILSMNIMEFFLVPELLLWGRFNILFAIFLSIIIYYNEFHFKNKSYV